MANRVTQVEAPPSGSLLTEVAARAHYGDTFFMRVPRATFPDVDALALACTRLPGWVSGMMRFRDKLVAPLGLKTTDDIPPPDLEHTAKHLAAGDRAGIFQILARNAHELLMGEDDRHLDFRFSLFLREEGAFQDIFATTTVHFHNVWGRLYFLFVAPIHRLIIPSMLRHALPA
jgi:hypothetical protein